jgi:hypothetical protein
MQAGFTATGATRRRQGIGISAPLGGKSLPLGPLPTDPECGLHIAIFFEQGNFHVVTRNQYLRINDPPRSQLPFAWP